jgi:hypothetical protein
VPSAYWKPGTLPKKGGAPAIAFCHPRAKSRNLEIDRYKARDVSTSLDMTKPISSHLSAITGWRSASCKVQELQGDEG